MLDPNVAMKNYYRIILGRKHKFFDEGKKGNFIGLGFLGKIDLSNDLMDFTEFSAKFVPIYLESHPDKTKPAASISCGMLWRTVNEIQIGDIVFCPDGKATYHVNEIQIGDIVFCPDGKATYHVGEISSNYQYHKDGNLPHRREVTWNSKVIPRTEMSKSLKNSSGSVLSMISITKYADEIESLLSDSRQNMITILDETVENASEFALEEQLEDFLVENWDSTELGKNYEIFQVDGEIVGQQYYTDVGEIDILAISKDKKSLLVIELKRGRASDKVVGQCLRYMGFVKSQVAETSQNVRGMIIAHEDDIKIRHALSVTQNIEFYTYKIDFQLEKKL